MHESKNDVTIYEAPCLQTYGKLELLTKGTTGSLLDGSTLSKGDD